jgi:integrase
VKLPREEVSENEGQLIVHLTVKEIKALFALDLPPLQRAVFSVAIYSGLRLDELWGLRWQDVTLDGKRPEIRVRRSYDGPCKTKHSRRDVPLLPPALAALKAWRGTQEVLPIGGLVFPAASGGCRSEYFVAGWRDKKTKKQTIPGWATKAGIRPEVTFHALRHTCGCHLTQGTWTGREMSLDKVKLWLGHSSRAVTERHYAAFTSDNLHNAVSNTGDLAEAFLTTHDNDAK